MNDFRSLKILDQFRHVFEKLHIDYDVMRKILQMKFTMDGRRIPTIFNQSKESKGNQFLKSLGLYMLFSLILIPFVFGNEIMFQMSIIYGMTMFFLMTSMIADFSVVLLDLRDTTILYTKPIHSKTINAAKFIHVFIYMVLLTGAFTLIPAIVMLFVHGIAFFILFVVSICFILLFVIALTSLVYIFVLRFFSGEQLKDLINYIQIALSIGIFVGYQIVLRAFDYTYLFKVYDFSWWHVFIPPMWFAAPYELFLFGNTARPLIILTILAIVVPIIAIYSYYRLMPSFERNLQKLMENAGKPKSGKGKISLILERIVCFKKEERMFFRFAIKMMGEEREFKLKVYPSLGMALVFPFIFIYNELSYRTMEEISMGNMYLWIYFVNLVVGTIVYMLQFSGNYKGAWIFPVAGFRHPGLMYRATLKAFLVKFYLPIFLFVSIIYTYIFTSKIILDLIIVFFAAILQSLFIIHITYKGSLPFSKPFESLKQGSSNTILTFGLMFISAIFAGVHFLILQIPYGTECYLIAIVIVVFVMWIRMFKNN